MLGIEGRRLPELAEDHLPYLSDPFDGHHYRNPWGVTPWPKVANILRWKRAGSAWASEKRRSALPPIEPHPTAAWHETSGPRVQWLGHASVLVEIDGVRVLIDPVFWGIGPVRRVVPAPRLAAISPIDAVLLTHNHPDHCDRRSLRAIAKHHPNAVMLVPSGVAKAVPPGFRSVHKLSWWQQGVVRGVALCLVPTQHWSRRTPFDTNRSLWGGWVIEGSRSVYHSGDTGYFAGFRTIGTVFPALDLAVLPLGAYEPRWFMAEQHMAPGDSLNALEDLGAKRLLGMHWGTFDLSDEPLEHGPKELLPSLIVSRGIDPKRVVVPAHGEVVRLAGGARPR